MIAVISDTRSPSKLWPTPNTTSTTMFQWAGRFDPENSIQEKATKHMKRRLPNWRAM